MKKVKVMICCLLLLSLVGCKSKQSAPSKQEEETTPTGIDQGDEDAKKGTDVTEPLTDEDNQIPDTKDEGETITLTQIEDQTFDVTLDGYGDVTFASYEPLNELEDVTFCLLNEKQECIAYLSEKQEKLSDEKFQEILAVAFRDYNEDGKKDILILCKYTMLEGAKEYNQVRLYTQHDEKEFVSDRLIEEYLMKNGYNESIFSMSEGIKAYQTNESAMKGAGSVTAQIRLIAKHRDDWIPTMDYANDSYNYAITDLDQNGRLEIIATNTGGSGMYSYSNYYEVNETFDGIKQCDYPYIEYDSQPDISFGNLGAYFDPNTGHYYYIFFDYMRGTGMDYYDSTSSISLQNGNIISRVLGSCSTTYNENGDIESEVCKDEYGKKIDSETYQTLSEKVYQDYTKYKVTFGWKDYTMDNNIVDIPMAELVDVLTKSYQGFSLEAE